MALKILSVTLRIILQIITLLIAIAEIIALFAPIVRPEGVSLMVVLTMVEPFLIAANFLLVLIWTILWKPWVFLPIVVLIFSVGRVDSYYSYRVSRDYSDIQSRNPVKKQLRLMTYNVKGFKNDSVVLDSVISTISSYDPDILCLVEFNALENIEAKINSALPKLKFHASDRGVKGSISQDHGIVLFSRYPLVNPTKYEYTEHGIAVGADAVLFYGDTIQVVGLHLESTNYYAISGERELEAYMGDSIFDQNGVMESIRIDSTRSKLKSRASTVISTLSERSYHRSLQADTIRERFIDSADRAIVMGDFNDTPYSYSVRTIQGELLDPFTMVPQNKYGYTFNMLHRLFRIDYIFLQKESFEVLDYNSPQLPYSDHNPVMVTVRRTY